MHLQVAAVISLGLSTGAISIPDLLGLFRILLTASHIKASGPLRHGRHLSDADRGLAATDDHRTIFDILN